MPPPRRPATREESANVTSFLGHVISFSVTGGVMAEALLPRPRVALWRQGHGGVTSPTPLTDLCVFAKPRSLYVLPQWCGAEKCNHHNFVLKICNVSDDRGTIHEHIQMLPCMREYVKCLMKQLNVTISSKELPHLKHFGKKTQVA